MSTVKIDVMDIFARSNLGFGHIGLIFGAVHELAERNPCLAARLAEFGRYIADDLRFRLDSAQDALDAEADEQGLRKLAMRKS